MNKNTALKRSATNRRFATKPLGKGKATKFAKVEGVTTSSKSAKTLKLFEIAFTDLAPESHRGFTHKIC